MKKLTLIFLACASFLKIDANATNDFYFSLTPYHAVDNEYVGSAIGASFGIKGRGESNGYDLGFDAYYTDEEELALYGQVQYVFYPIVKSIVNPYLGVGVSFPVLYMYGDFLAFNKNQAEYNNDEYDISWNQGLLFSVKSTIGITYPLRALRGFTEFSFMYPTVNGTTLEIYKKENMKLPDAINMKVGFLF